jgi:hypothetical protein
VDAVPLSATVDRAGRRWEDGRAMPPIASRRRATTPPGAVDPDRRADERPQQTVVALQRAAGNRAVSGLVQRQGTGGWSFSPIAPRPPDLRLPATSPLAGTPAARLSEEAAAKVRAYLEGRRYEIGSKVSDGAISMPEVVQQVRENVPESVSAPIADLEAQVRAVFGGITPPPVRRRRTAQGAGAEIGARIANALPSAPRLRVDIGGGSIRLTAAGVVASAKVGSATVTATGGPSGGELKAEDGSASIAVTGSATAFGLEAKLDRAAFAAKIEKDDKSGNWSKWELGLRIAVVGDEPLEEMTDIPGLSETVAKAEAAIRGIVAHLQAGGRPDDPKVKELMKDVKPAIEGVKRAVEKPASGPRVTVGASAKGGDEKLGTTAGLSLIVEF